MRALVWLTILGVATPALPCEVVFLPVNGLFTELTSAPAGGLWWLQGTDESITLASGDFAERVVIGPTVSAYRVPQIEPGTYGRFVVEPGAVPTREAPEIVDVTATTQREIRTGNPCSIGFSERIDTPFTDVAISLQSEVPPDQLLFDAWVLRADQDFADVDDATTQRAIEAHPGSALVIADGAVRVRVEDDGPRVAHVRVRDPVTGEASTIESVAFDNGGPVFAGWDLAGGWHWGCAATEVADAWIVLAMPLLLLLGKRRRGGRSR